MKEPNMEPEIKTNEIAILKAKLDALNREKTMLENELRKTSRELDNTKKALTNLSFLKAKVKGSEQPFWRKWFR